jgi:energy-coupling factor transporter ATP-binding protein EcfA2
LLSLDSLSTADEGELYEMLKAANGLNDSERPSPVPQPVKSSFQQPSTAIPKVVLKKLHSLKDVNALVGGHAIVFEVDGVTVVYGCNGAGKSGYSRVMKKACHARENTEPIHPNLFRNRTGIPEACFDLEVNGGPVEFRWVNGQPSSEHLAQVAVFDSHCARVFLDDANEVVYLPYGLDIFGRLASLCKSFKDRLQSEIAKLGPPPQILSQFAPATTIGKILSGLRHDSSLDKLEATATWTPEDRVRSTKLEQMIAESKANSPSATAESLRRQKRRIDALRANILAIDKGLSETAALELRQAYDASVAAREAAKLASSEVFANEPLAGVGGAAWKRMYEAAARYASEANPETEFPATASDSLCVWCQQPLSADASDRLRRFKQFVQQDTATQNVQQSVRLQGKVTAINSVNVSPPDAELIAELSELAPACVDVMDAYFASAGSRRAALSYACEDGTWDGVPKLLTSPAQGLARVVLELEAQAVEFDSLARPEAQAKLEAEFAELLAKKKLASGIDDIRNHMARLKREHNLRQCIEQTATNAITKAGSQLMDQAVTVSLEAAIISELKHFGLDHFSIKLKKSGDYGTTRHQLQIANCAAKVDLSGILSEGEQRVVAIASFLAELKTHSHCGPIVFDDPVSSLDHLFREKVAERLVREGKTRQVVVFSHDIVMLLAIERAASLERVKLHVQTVRRDIDGPGACDPSKPWHAMGVAQRVVYIREQLEKARSLHKANDLDYCVEAARCYGLLRETWERAVEEVVLNDAIQRYRASIETKRLMAVTFDSNDYATIDQAMAKCSTHMTGHDSAGAIGSAPPTPQEIDADITALHQFAKAINKRKESVRKQAEELIEPPVSTAVA